MTKPTILAVLALLLGAAAPMTPLLASAAEAAHGRDDHWSLAACIRLRTALGIPTRGCYPRVRWEETRPLPPGLRRPGITSDVIGKDD